MWSSVFVLFFQLVIGKKNKNKILILNHQISKENPFISKMRKAVKPQKEISNLSRLKLSFSDYSSSNHIKRKMLNNFIYCKLFLTDD